MIEIITSNIFPNDRIIAGITTKNVSEYPPFGFSITPALIYDDETISKHREDLCNQLTIPLNHLKIQKQIHSDIIRIVNSNSGIDESDAMITIKKGFVINVSIADCAAVLIYCQDVDVISGIHSGWQGTKLNIVGKTINKLINEFGALPQNMLVYISPSAGGEKYEVEFDVAKYFPNSIVQISETKYLFDNKKELKTQLLECGVIGNNIECSPICTISDDNFHSYRRDKNTSGRMSAFIGIIN